MVTQLLQTNCPVAYTWYTPVSQTRSRSQLQCSKRRLSSGVSTTCQKQHQHAPIEITYPGTGNTSHFTFDGLGQCVKIIEQVGGLTATTNQFVVESEDKVESRDASGAVIAQYYHGGQVSSGSEYFYTGDHLGAVRELISTSIQAQYTFDPFGVASKLQGGGASDFQYASYYFHSRSWLNLTQTRPYMAKLGRWLSRDPADEEENANLYCYVANRPTLEIDPSGLAGNKPDPAPQPFKNCHVGDKSCCAYNRNRCRESCPPCDRIKSRAPLRYQSLYPTTRSCNNCCEGIYSACANVSIALAAQSINSRAYSLGLASAGCSQHGNTSSITTLAGLPPFFNKIGNGLWRFGRGLIGGFGAGPRIP